MVEICLRAMDALDNFPRKDAYVSVRVGEQQKFSKLSGAKSFKFPASAAKDRRFGKVELFQRLGVATVALDGCTNAVQEVYLPTADGDCRLSVEVGDGASSGIASMPAAPKDRSIIDEAKSYMDKHFVEARLAQAMQAILRDRPEDPIAFLSAHLVAGAGKNAAPSNDASAPPKAEVPNPECVASVAASNPQVVVQSPFEAAPQLVPFRTYYSANMNTCQQVFGSIHAKFQGRAESAVPCDGSAAISASSQDVPRGDAPCASRDADSAESGQECSEQPDQCVICQEAFEQGAPYFPHPTDKSKGLCVSCMEAMSAPRPTNCSSCDVVFADGCAIFVSESIPSRVLCKDCVRLLPGGPLSDIAEGLDEDAASTHVSEQVLDDVHGGAVSTRGSLGAASTLSDLSGQVLDDVHGVLASAGPPDDLAGRAATRDAVAMRHQALVKCGASPNSAAVRVIRDARATAALRGY